MFLSPPNKKVWYSFDTTKFWHIKHNRGSKNNIQGRQKRQQNTQQDINTILRNKSNDFAAKYSINDGDRGFL